MIRARMIWKHVLSHVWQLGTRRLGSAGTVGQGTLDKASPCVLGFLTAWWPQDGQTS